MPEEATSQAPLADAAPLAKAPEADASLLSGTSDGRRRSSTVVETARSLGSGDSHGVALDRPRSISLHARSTPPIPRHPVTSMSSMPRLPVQDSAPVSMLVLAVAKPAAAKSAGRLHDDHSDGEGRVEESQDVYEAAATNDLVRLRRALYRKRSVDEADPVSAVLSSQCGAICATETLVGTCRSAKLRCSLLRTTATWALSRSLSTGAPTSMRPPL